MSDKNKPAPDAIDAPLGDAALGHLNPETALVDESQFDASFDDWLGDSLRTMVDDEVGPADQIDTLAALQKIRARSEALSEQPSSLGGLWEALRSWFEGPRALTLGAVASVAIALMTLSPLLFGPATQVGIVQRETAGRWEHNAGAVVDIEEIDAGDDLTPVVFRGEDQTTFVWFEPSAETL